MITLTLTSAGLTLARRGATLSVAPHNPADLARAIAQLTGWPAPTPAQLGRRLALARQRYVEPR